MWLGTQLSGVTASNRRRTSDVFTPRTPSSTAAGSGGWRVRIWASTCSAVTWSLRRLGFDASSSTFFAAGVMRRRSFCATSLILGFFGTARIGSGGASVPDPQAEGSQGFLIERLKDLASLLQADAYATSIEGCSNKASKT